MRKITCLILALLIVFGCSFSLAHSGRTDSNGGHHDWDNGGAYHYHHGHEAHQHPNGVCPYGDYKSASPTSTPEPTAKPTATPKPKASPSPTSQVIVSKSIPVPKRRDIVEEIANRHLNSKKTNHELSVSYNEWREARESEKRKQQAAESEANKSLLEESLNTANQRIRRANDTIIALDFLLATAVIVIIALLINRKNSK